MRNEKDNKEDSTKYTNLVRFVDTTIIPQWIAENVADSLIAAVVVDHIFMSEEDAILNFFIHSRKKS